MGCLTAFAVPLVLIVLVWAWGFILFQVIVDVPFGDDAPGYAWGIWAAIWLGSMAAGVLWWRWLERR